MLVALTFIAATAGRPADASKLTLSAPAAIVEIDTRKLKGELFHLSWSPDAKQMYLQTIERDSTGNIGASHHYVMALDGHAPAQVDQEPVWSATYWAWKSTQAAPGMPTLRIELEEQQKRVSATATPMGGDLAKGGPEGSPTGSNGGVGATGAISAALQTQVAHYYTLKLKGDVVGEFVNAAAIPGFTYGWGPAGTGLIAFANRDGRVVIMDDQGRKQTIPSSKSALLPGWTDDGSRLAYLERTGKNKVVLKVVEVTRPAQ